MLIKCTFFPPEPDNRIAMIKDVRQVTQCGLKESKDFADTHFYYHSHVDNRWYPVDESVILHLTPEQYCRYVLAPEGHDGLRMNFGQGKIVEQETDKIFMPNP